MLKRQSKVLLEKEDEELVKMVQDGNEQVLEQLYVKYKGLIYEVSYKYMMNNKIAQMYLDDLIDIATECLLIACKDFNVGQDRSFLNYWWAIVERRQKDFQKKAIESRVYYYDPFMIENSVSSLSDSHPRGGYEGVFVSIIETINKNEDLFTQDERIYLKYFLIGYKPIEIAELLSWNKSKMYRVKNKAMDKLNKIIKSN